MNTQPSIVLPQVPLSVNVDGADIPIGRPPSSRQWEVIRAAEKEQLYGGAKRGGKSVVECIKLFLLCVLFPGNRVGLFRKTLKDLRESTLITWDKLFPMNHPLILGHHRTQFVYTIRSIREGVPSYLSYGGLGDIHEIDTAKGKEYGAFAIDEPSEIDEGTYLQLLAQLCWVLPDGSRPPYQAILGSNPEPGWVEDRFRPLIDKTSDTVGSATDGGKIFVRALPRDNPYLPPNWEDELRTTIKNQAWIDKYIGGSWDVSEGQRFKEFSRDTHTIRLTDLSPAYLASLRLYYSIDHATTGITCMVIAGQDPDSNIIALGSYYEANKLISEHAQGMKNLMDEWAIRCGREGQIKNSIVIPGQHPAVAAFEYGLIDPSTQAKTLQSKAELTSVQDEYVRHGIPTQPAWNAIETGLNLVDEYLHIRPTHVHPIFRQPDGAPRLGSPAFFIVTDGNKDGISEIVKFKKTIDQFGRIKYAGRDHWLDNVRYIMMSRPEPPLRTATDISVLDTWAQKAVKSHSKWADRFGKPAPEANQWFSRIN